MSITKEVYEIVSRHSLKKPEALSNELYIEQDLKLVGDEANELIEEIQKKFEIDFSGFVFSLHFSPETGWPENPEFGYYPVTIGHLVEVVKSKRWFLPERNEANFQKERKRTIFSKIAVALSIILFACYVLYLK